MKRALPWIVVVLAALYLLLQGRPPKPSDDGMNLEQFGKIPVVYNGRVKPLDTFARTLLRVVSERETFVDEKGKSQPAVRWLLECMMYAMDDHGHGKEHKVFRIRELQALEGLGLKPREGYRYSIEEFGERLPQLGEQMRSAHEKKVANRPMDAYERELLKFEQNLTYFKRVADFSIPHLVPPSGTGVDWRTLPEAMQSGAGNEAYAKAFVNIIEAYAAHDAGKFNLEVAAYLERLRAERPSDMKRMGIETVFNRIDPFNLSGVFYLAAFTLSCLAWLAWPDVLNRTATRLILFTWIVHTLALVARMYLSGRPPVTNLYSSAIFIGWGMVVIGLIFERIFRLGVGNVVGSAAGFTTLLIAYILSADGDTMEVLQAVLDTQFWLATHVTCITFGYATTYVAGLIGLIYILRGFLTNTLTEELRATLARMIYGVVCFSMFFSFVGTVLGGLWADDSWGRFWGWDPKENGALMIVLWNALILHARWGGLVRERGLAVLAVFGNIVVSWSWFGVNELGVGLHSYGFTEGRKLWLGLFALSQLAVMILGMMPRSLWKSEAAVRA